MNKVTRNKVRQSKLQQELARRKLNVDLAITGCNGLCHREPIVEVVTSKGKWTYANIKAARVAELIDRHLVGGSDDQTPRSQQRPAVGHQNLSGRSHQDPVGIWARIQFQL